MVGRGDLPGAQRGRLEGTAISTAACTTTVRLPDAPFSLLPDEAAFDTPLLAAATHVYRVKARVLTFP